MDAQGARANPIPTGSLRLDLALGTGGLPRGRFIEIFGPDASGKTTLCQHIIAEAQKMGESCAFIDVDHGMDSRYALRCGVDPDHLHYSEPMHAEQALDIVTTLARTDALAVIVIDSVSTLIPANDLQLDWSTTSRRYTDTLLSAAMRNLNGIIRKNNTTIVFTRLAGSSKSAVYHRLAKNPARLALKLHSAIRLELRPLSQLCENRKVIGNRVQVRIQKNTFQPCSRSIELDIMYNDGIEKAGEIFDLGTQLRIIDIEQSTFYYQGLKLGRKRQEAVGLLKANRALADEIEQVIRQKLLTTGLDLIA